MKVNPQLFRLFGLFDSLDDVMVWIKDRNGRYVWVNQTFVINYALENPQDSPLEKQRTILKKTDYDLSPAFLADQFRLDDEHVLAGNSILHRIELVGPSAEDLAWHVTSKIPFCDARGKITGTVGMTRRLNPSEKEAVPASGFGSVLAYMRDHYPEALTNPQLARMANMSVRAFERKFYGSFHLTPQRYLRRLRLRIASRMLLYTAIPWWTRQWLVDLSTKATSRASSSASWDGRREIIVCIMGRKLTLPLLGQKQPLPFNKSRAMNRRCKPKPSPPPRGVHSVRIRSQSPPGALKATPFSEQRLPF
jgi:AraC-like DNA-binding protein